MSEWNYKNKTDILIMQLIKKVPPNTAEANALESQLKGILDRLAQITMPLGLEYDDEEIVKVDWKFE